MGIPFGTLVVGVGATVTGDVVDGTMNVVTYGRLPQYPRSSDGVYGRLPQYSTMQHTARSAARMRKAQPYRGNVRGPMLVVFTIPNPRSNPTLPASG